MVTRHAQRPTSHFSSVRDPRGNQWDGAVVEQNRYRVPIQTLRFTPTEGGHDPNCGEITSRCSRGKGNDVPLERQGLRAAIIRTDCWPVGLGSGGSRMRLEEFESPGQSKPFGRDQSESVDGYSP